MKYFVTAGIVVVIACLAASMSHARDMNENGYTWNSLSVEERESICKIFARAAGKDYRWWLYQLNEYYDTTDPQVLKWTIPEAAALIGGMQRGLEKLGQ